LSDESNVFFLYYFQSKSVGGDETSAIILGLDEGVEYEFRLVPNNDGGAGEPSDPTPPVKTKAQKGQLPKFVTNIVILIFLHIEMDCYGTWKLICQSVTQYVTVIYNN